MLPAGSLDAGCAAVGWVVLTPNSLRRARPPALRRVPGAFSAIPLQPIERARPMSKLLRLTLGLSGLRVFGFVVDPWLSNGGNPPYRRRTVTNQPASDGEDHLQVITRNIERGADTPPSSTNCGARRRLSCCCRKLTGTAAALNTATSRAIWRVRVGMNWIAAGEFQEIGEARRGRPRQSPDKPS